MFLYCYFVEIVTREYTFLRKYFNHRSGIPTKVVDIMLFQRPLCLGSLPEFLFDTMGMTYKECLKANFAFELFLFYLRYPRDSFKVVGIQFKDKL